MTVPVAHDFICPWCWIGLFQAKKLQEEFGVDLDWFGYEIFPEELEWPTASAPAPTNPNKPPIPTRLDLAYAAQAMEKPTTPRPKGMRSHNAHEAVEYAKTEGAADALVEKLYNAYWLEGKRINDPEVIGALAKGIIKDIPEMLAAIKERRFKDKIVGFDEPAYGTGIYNVPTFIIGGERYPEESYMTLRKAMSNQMLKVG